MNAFIRILRYEWPLHFTLLLTSWWPDNVMLMKWRGSLISPYFAKCGKNFKVGRGNIFVGSFNMSIGDNVYISNGNWFNCSGGIRIGNEVLFGPSSLIVTSNHTRLNGSFRFGKSELKPI